MAAIYNWTAAFVAFCNAVPLEEISAVFSIPVDTLENKIRTESWQKLRTKLPPSEALVPVNSESRLPAVPDDREAKLAALQENRNKNLAVFSALRDDLVELVTRLRDSTLQVERQWHNRGLVTRAMVDLSISDRVNLAVYAKTVAEGTYRALGDFAAAEKAGQDAVVGQAAAPAITIILPGVIAAPRKDRENQVIDLTRPQTAIEVESRVTTETPPEKRVPSQGQDGADAPG